jgi:hypothetical protein
MWGFLVLYRRMMIMEDWKKDQFVLLIEYLDRLIELDRNQIQVKREINDVLRRLHELMGLKERRNEE